MLNDLFIKNLINNYDVINRFRREVSTPNTFFEKHLTQIKPDSQNKLKKTLKIVI